MDTASYNNRCLIDLPSIFLYLSLISKLARKSFQYNFDARDPIEVIRSLFCVIEHTYLGLTSTIGGLCLKPPAVKTIRLHETRVTRDGILHS